MDRPEWKQRWLDAYAEHAGWVSEYLDIPEEGFPESIRPLWTMLEPCILEDFFTTRFPDGEDGGGSVNIIQDYLKRRGWKESVPGRRYLEALRDSIPSLYEVIEVNPGKSMKLKDLTGIGGPIVVLEKSATKELVTWDCVAARVISMNGCHYLTGGVLPFLPEMSKWFLDLYYEQTGTDEQSRSFRRGELYGGVSMSWLLSSFWVGEMLMVAKDAMPVLRNSDGELILLCEVHFPVLGDMTAVASVLDEIPALVRSHEDEEAEESDGGMLWAWVGPGNPGYRSMQHDKGVALPKEVTEDMMDDIGLTELGHIVLNTETLLLGTCSKESGERGRALLASHLGDLVGQAVTSYKDVQTAIEYLGELAGSPAKAETKSG